jgi:hypothetical protein
MTNALIHLGPQAAPYLVRNLSTRRMRRYEWAKSKLPDFLAKHVPDPVQAKMETALSYEVLWALGPAASTAVLDLIALLNRGGCGIKTNRREAKRCALICLGCEWRSIYKQLRNDLRLITSKLTGRTFLSPCNSRNLTG